jgi:hypothetical protein
MLTHNATHNEVIDDIFRNTHAPARKCHISASACLPKIGVPLGVCPCLSV